MTKILITTLVVAPIGLTVGALAFRWSLENCRDETWNEIKNNIEKARSER